MTQIPWGWGDASGQDSGAYGDHQYGYGHANQILPLWCAQGLTQPDVGGERLDFDTVIPGTLPIGPVTVRIGDVVCYSGIQQQSSDVYPDTARRKFSCCLPHLYGTTGPVDVRVTGAGWDFTWVGAITVVRHPARSGVTLLATRHPTEVYATNLYIPRS